MLKCRTIMTVIVTMMGIWVGLTLPGRAAVDPVTAATILPAVPTAVKVVKDVAAIPMDVADVLRLPLGITEMVLAPLPGINFTSGLKDTGQGVIAPFKLVGDVLKLPYNLVGGLSDVSQKVALVK